MDIFNDFDLCQEAMKKIDLSEAAMPVVRGVIVEDVDTYNKIQRLLNTPALEPCHRFLYNLDVEQLTEDEVNKVNNLYKLGQDRGFIEPDAEDDIAAQPADVAPEPAPQPPAPKPSPVDNVAFTVAYSAMKDGMMKTGEAYSNAVSTRAAKADVISKLERAGYSSIEILCIEAGDPDVRGCKNTYCAQPTCSTTEEEKVNEWGRYETGLYKGPMRDPSPADMAAWRNTHDHAYMQKRDAAASLKRTIDSFKKYDNKAVDWEEIAQTEEDGVTYYWMKTPEGTLVCAVENDPHEGLEFYIVDDKNKIMTMVGQSYGVGEEFEFNPTGAEYEIPKDMPAVTEADKEKDDSKADADKASDDKADDSDSDSDNTADDAGKEADSKADDKSNDGKDSAEDNKDNSDDKDDSDGEKEEDAEEPDEKLDDKADDKAENATDDKDEKDLTAEEKTALKDSYKKAFKAAMQKCKFETSFSELSLDEKVKFFTELAKAWGDKADPSKFMTDKEIDQLEKIVVKPKND